MAEAERLAQALENSCSDWDGRKLKKPVVTCAELREAAAELRRLSADAQRLDWIEWAVSHELCIEPWQEGDLDDFGVLVRWFDGTPLRDHEARATTLRAAIDQAMKDTP